MARQEARRRCSRCRAISRRIAGTRTRWRRSRCEVRTAGAAGRLFRRLVIPGGESTTMLKLLEDEKLLEPLREFGRREADFRHLRRRDSAGHRCCQLPRRQRLGLMDISVERNAYGRQIDSRIAAPESGRGPGRRPGSRVHPRSDHPPRGQGRARCWRAIDGDPVLVEQGRHMVATFHPELTDDPRVHLMFLQKIP